MFIDLKNAYFQAKGYDSNKNVDYIKETDEINTEIEVIGKYVDNNTPIPYKCKLCNNTFIARPISIIYGLNCPNCYVLNTYNNKITNNGYLFKLDDLKSLVFPIESIINSRTKSKHKCITCNYIWETTPDNIVQKLKKNKTGCPQCNKLPVSNRLKPQKQYEAELELKNPTIKLVEPYINGRTKSMHECLVCNYKWKVRPESVLYGSGCPNCNNKKISERFKKSHEQYIKELFIKNPNLQCLEEYITDREKILHKCLSCNYEWKISPNNTLSGHSCPKCNTGGRTGPLITFEDYKKSLINRNIKVGEDFVDLYTPCIHKCLICDHIWETRPEYIRRGHGCPNCAIEALIKRCTKTHEQYVIDLSNKNPELEVVEKYIDSRTHINHRCKKCNYIWKIQPYRALLGHGCPFCATSRGEKRIKLYLDGNNIFYKSHHPFEGLIGVGGGLLSYDFYLPQYNLLCEFQGVQHEKPIEIFGGEKQFKIQQEHDKRKRDYAEKHKIELLEIWYYEFDKIEEILSEKLLNKSLTTAG